MKSDDSGGHIDKEDVLQTGVLKTLAELWVRTRRFEAKLHDNVQVPHDYAARLSRRVNLAAQSLRDWGLNARAEELLYWWGDFHGAWTNTGYPSVWPGLLGKLNQSLGDFLRELWISAGHTELLDDVRENAARIDDDTVELLAQVAGLPPDHTPKLRPAYRRDHLWVRWQEDGERFGPTKIRNRWNALSKENRELVAPRCSHRVGKDSSGIETVKRSLKTAKKERKQQES
jgi:hypothetical protein